DDVADVMWSVLIVFVVGLFEYSIDFAKTAAPLYKFTKKNAVFNKSVCGDKERIAYNTIKENLTTPPLLLHFPDDESKLVLETDASGIDLGAILRQMTLHGPKVIKYLSKTFDKAQQKYSTTEKECKTIVWAIDKLKPYL
ncbi:unnamed protein product, partial [Didymodactylos carnosus]